MADCVVIGLGKLGVCLAALLSDGGNNVKGIDTNETTVALINSKEPPVDEPGLRDLLDRAGFEATTRYEEGLAGATIAFIVLPTPSLPDSRYDDYLIWAAIDEIVSVADGPKAIVVCSTVMPGTTERIGEYLGSDYDVLYSPEFIALGSVIEDMRNPDMVLIGTDGTSQGETTAEALCAILGTFIASHRTVEVCYWTEAELAKISVNAYVTMKISFANELTAICDGYEDVSARRVCQAVGSDTRIGHKYLKPGTAFGGPCFPRDGRAFGYAARKAGTQARLAEATDIINNETIERAVQWVRGLAIRGPVAILGLTYKPNSYVTEESAGVRLAEALFAEGCAVYAYDPTLKGTGNLAMLDFLDDANLCRAVLVMTPWPEFAGFDARVPTYDPWSIVPANDLVYRPGEP